MVKQTFDDFTLEIIEGEDGASIIIAEHPEGPAFVDGLSISIGTHQFNIERSGGFLHASGDAPAVVDPEWLRKCAIDPEAWGDNPSTEDCY
jgi:hypothetical protein